jgi:bifunctional non-homologous end joining protein LigD
MRLAVRREPFDHPDWLFELKFDGFRSLAVIESGSCRLISRNAQLYKPFPHLRASLAQIPHGCIIDGEIVCRNAEGRPQFDTLFRRRAEPNLYAFDLLHLDGRDLRTLPLIERKRILRGIVPRSDSRLLYVSHIERHGVDLFREVCRQDLEGIVAKWKYGTYASGYETSWVKIKNPAYSQAIGRWEKLQRKGIAKESMPTQTRASSA